MKKLICIIIAVTFLASLSCAYADAVNTSISVSNSIPTVSSLVVTSPVDLSSGNVTVWCNATLTDNNGHSNIVSANATFWNSAYATETASDNISKHYTNASCSLGSNTSSTKKPAYCSFNIDYSANTGTWTCKIRARDNSSVGTSTVNATIYDCGDGVCSSGETCSVCSTDCGTCLSGNIGGAATGGIRISENITGEAPAEVLPFSMPTLPPSPPEEGLPAPSPTGAAASPPATPLGMSWLTVALMVGLLLVIVIFTVRTHPIAKTYYKNYGRRR